MSDEVFDLTAFQRDLLASIPQAEAHERGDGEPSGVNIRLQAQDIRNEDIPHGRLYPNLDDLVDAGFVDKCPLDERTNGYTLTEAGLGALEDITSYYYAAEIKEATQ